MTQARGHWRHERQWNKEQRHMDQSGKKSRKMEGNGKWIRNDCSRSICWQCAKQKKSSARSSSTRTVPERCEAGRTRGGEHHGATHRGPDWLWLIQRQTSPVNRDTKSNTKELMPRRADELKPHRWQSLPHFSLRPLFPLSNESVDSAALLKFHSFSWNTCVSTCFWIQSNLSQQRPVDLSTRDSVLCLEQSTKSLPCPLSKTYRHIRFFLCVVMTPALMSAGPLKDEIRRPIEERRNTVKGDKHQLSKRIKACIRDRKRTKRQEKIQRILEEFRGIKSFSCTTSGRKRTVVPKVKNDRGETITSRKGVANVFGAFYSKLYAENRLGEEVQDPQNLEIRMNTEQKSYHEDLRNEIPEFTQVEIQAAIDSFNKGEASDNTGRRRQDKRRNDKRNDKTDLQRSVEARGLHTRNMKDNTYKSDQCGRSW